MGRAKIYPRARAKHREVHVAAARLGGLSALSRKLGISHGRLATIAGGTEVMITTADRIATAVGRPLEELFDIIGAPELPAKAA